MKRNGFFLFSIFSENIHQTATTIYFLIVLSIRSQLRKICEKEENKLARTEMSVGVLGMIHRVHKKHQDWFASPYFLWVLKEKCFFSFFLQAKIKFSVWYSNKLDQFTIQQAPTGISQSSPKCFFLHIFRRNLTWLLYQPFF